VLTLGHSYLDSARTAARDRAVPAAPDGAVAGVDQFSVLDGDDVVYVSRVNAPRHLTPGFEPGTRLPAYTSTAGRVLLAGLPDEPSCDAYLARVELVPYTHMTVLDREQLRRELLAPSASRASA
jgi:IclR family pca regulon transcriptional regulator